LWKQLILFGGFFISEGYEEVILPSIWEQQTFIDKAGKEILNQMWAFKDKGNRDVCLIPEVTGLIQEIYREQWNSLPKPIKVFYVSRCYRYDRPQLGRYREFTQIGVEVLGNKDYYGEVVGLLKGCLDQFNLEYKFVPQVKRGLAYYLEEGFEVECSKLGAQKQIAGGGRYAEGIGWAIGLDRLLLACE
jgi:histidyl-tRNA synthetase